MKGRIKVVGLGRRMAGTSSKNGRNYDFIPVSFVFSDDQYEGLRAANVNIDGPLVDAVGGLKVGSECEAVYHFANRQMFVDDLR